MWSHLNKEALRAHHEELDLAFSHLVDWLANQSVTVDFTEQIKLKPDRNISVGNITYKNFNLGQLLFVFLEHESGIQIPPELDEEPDWERRTDDLYIKTFPVMIPAFLERISTLIA